MPINYGQYRKYSYVSWTQPVLTSNTSSPEIKISDPFVSGGKVVNNEMVWGTDGFEYTNNVYLAMDSNTSNYFNLKVPNKQASSSERENQTFNVFDMEFDRPIKITKVRAVGMMVSGYASQLTGLWVYKVDGNNVTRIGYARGGGALEANVNSVIAKKIRICLRPDWDQHEDAIKTRITELTITATKGDESVPGTSSDYDYIGTFIGEIYHESTPISKVYRGNKLVWKSLSENLNVWRFSNSSGYLFLIGNYDTNDIILSSMWENVNTTLTNISGVLGQSGSSIQTAYSGTYGLDYYTTHTINNKIIHEYICESGLTMWDVLVIDGASINDTVVIGYTGSNYLNIVSLSDNNIIYTSYGTQYTMPRDTSYFALFTEQGILEQ